MGRLVLQCNFSSDAGLIALILAHLTLFSLSLYSGRLDYIEEQTSKIVRESEHRINQKVKESERRIRECDLAAKVEIKKDIRNVLQAVVKHRDEDDYS
mmetsp:Transcript_25473/g.75027  ORF Transcript_25473/g.75027 Transcript_25473/m.75027 type:complete len:98 (-) Transcript_25473:340-633(-)